MSKSKYNKKFKKKYNKLFKKDPLTANIFLLFMDLADKNGQFKLPSDEEAASETIGLLLAARFNDPTEYQL